MEIHDNNIISFPNFPSTKQGHQSKPTKTKTFVFVKALKRGVWNVLTVGCFNFFLEFFFGGVTVVQTVHLETQMSPLLISQLLNECHERKHFFF